MLVEMRTAGTAWMSKFQTLLLLACTVQLYIFIYNHTWEGCAVSVPITGSNPSHCQKYYFPRICLFLSLFPVALEAQEKNCFTCGLVSVKESGAKKGQIWPQSNPRHTWPVLVSFCSLDIVQAPRCPHSLPVFFSYWHHFSRSWVNFVCNSGPGVSIHISILCLVKITSVTWKIFSGSSSRLLFLQEMHSFLRHAFDLIRVILFPDVAVFFF